jgi:hypothetical protein
VFLGKSVQELNAVQARKALQGEDGAGAGNPLLAGPNGDQIRILPEMYPEHNSVFRLKPTDPKQRSWFVFDHALVLPEYLVEFEYEVRFTRLSVDRLQQTRPHEGLAPGA